MNEKLKSLSESFCFHPWTQLSMNPSGELMNCCQQKAESGLFFDHPGDIEKYWNSDQQKELRKDLLAGRRPSVCETCWASEAAGMCSKRQHELNYKPAAGIGEEQVLKVIEASRLAEGFNDFMPTYLDFKPGNKCNLKCRMCVPENSHLIHKELLENAEAMKPFESYYSYGLSEGNRPQWNHQVKAEKLLGMSKNLRRINISGGEPLLNPLVKDYIELLVKEKVAQQIHITFNTNGLLLNSKLYELFSHFNKAEVYVSVDGVESIYEYIRYPARWVNLDKNMDEIVKFARPNVRIIVSPTLQALNALSVGDIYRWAMVKGAHFHCGGHVTFPGFHSPLILPQEARSEAISRLESLKGNESHNKADFPLNEIIEYLGYDETEYQGYREDFVAHTQSLDKIRGQNFKASCPELYSYVSNWFER